MNRASAPVAAPMSDRLQGIARTKNAAEIPPDKIDRDPDQPREEFEPGALGRLAESIRARASSSPSGCAGMRSGHSTSSSAANADGGPPGWRG